MRNNLLKLKIFERLNKLSSFDYDNIEDWQIAEAYNKARLEWIRRQLHGTNAHKEGGESSVRRIDDLQVLVKDQRLAVTRRPRFYETAEVPGDYLEYRRLSCTATTPECVKARPMKVYLSKERDVDVLLEDELSRPSFEWAETFSTMAGNRLKIYTNNEFTVGDVKLTYYRKPVPISFEGSVNPETGDPTNNVECIFKDDVMELIIDEAVSILAGDLENSLQYQRGSQQAERNN